MKKKRLTGKYVLPRIEKLDIFVEHGFALSVSYGEDGAAGEMLGGDGDEGIYEI